MSTFAWCLTNQHDMCIRKYQRFYINPRNNELVWLDEHIECECKKRGCECYVPAKERTKKARTRKRKG